MDAAGIEELAAIVREAPSPNRGWAPLCEKLDAAEPLRAINLADAALDLRARLTVPRRVDTLTFVLTTKRRAVLVLGSAELALEGLAAIHRAAAGQRGKAREAIERLLFGAAALVARFAADHLRHRVVVVVAGGPAVEVAARKPSRRKHT